MSVSFSPVQPAKTDDWAGLWFCGVCAAVVGDRSAHARWHSSVAEAGGKA